MQGGTQSPTKHSGEGCTHHYLHCTEETKKGQASRDVGVHVLLLAPIYSIAQPLFVVTCHPLPKYRLLNGGQVFLCPGSILNMMSTGIKYC